MAHRNNTIRRFEDKMHKDAAKMLTRCRQNTTTDKVGMPFAGFEFTLNRVQSKVEEKSCRNDEAECGVGFVGWISAA
ncbi:MAG: hypothetical protein LBB51_04450 [Zoogloeaceae bacterium]|jgi:hypothetical protein|nr:hypothetical protein [Zoogloeaceae bacterium]